MKLLHKIDFWCIAIVLCSVSCRSRDSDQTPAQLFGTESSGSGEPELAIFPNGVFQYDCTAWASHDDGHFFVAARANFEVTREAMGRHRDYLQWEFGTAENMQPFSPFTSGGQTPGVFDEDIRPRNFTIHFNYAAPIEEKKILAFAEVSYETKEDDGYRIHSAQSLSPLGKGQILEVSTQTSRQGTSPERLPYVFALRCAQVR